MYVHMYKNSNRSIGARIRQFYFFFSKRRDLRKMCEISCSTLLQDAATYQPDTLDLNKDNEAAQYWFPCVRDMVIKFARQAVTSQQNDETATKRAKEFQDAYLQQLAEYQCRRDKSTTVLSIRELLELNETELRRFGFPDPWLEQKEKENTAAMALLAQRLQQIDGIQNSDARWTELVRGVLAGNMFDWGAQAVANILENDKNFGLDSALSHIEKRPWLMDSLDDWLQRMQRTAEPHKCAVIFVDNSGVDIVLGILPFARELLKRGTKVLLCANTQPALNDVTCEELQTLLNSCSNLCRILADAWSTNRLQVYGNGQRGPCLDMRTLSRELCEAITKNETDLLVIEGMGRALHTNLYAKFSCETLKLAVVKNQWLAQHLGGDTFAVICRYEQS